MPTFCGRMGFDECLAGRMQSRDSQGGKGRVATPIKDDGEGHLIYKAGDIINGRCTILVVTNSITTSPIA